MAEAEKKETPEEATPAAPSKKKRTLIAVGGVLGLLVLIGVPAGYFILAKEEPKEVQEVKPEMAPEIQHKPEGFEDVEELEEGEEPLGAIVPFDTFLVNLSGGKYIRTQIQVEFETLDVPTKFYTRQVPIRDSIISLLTQQTAEALQSAQGKERIRNDIRNLINQTLRREDVRRVYFTQFVIQ